MDIKFYGQACFSMEDKSISVLLDPFDETVNDKLPQWQAQVVTISQEDSGHSYNKAVQGEPMIFRWPGEYETKGVHFKGIHSVIGENDDIENNIFVIHFSGIKFCHLGALKAKLTESQLEQIGDVDVLFVPVGGGSTLNPKRAKEVVEQIEPRIVIPMMYATEGQKRELGPLSAFLSEMGATTAESVDSFKVKKSELPEDNSKVVVLNAS